MKLAKKIRLKPTKEQEELLRKSAGVARFIYNYALAKQKQSKKYIQESVIRKEITQLKKTKEFEWLKEVSNDIPKQAVKDLDKAFKSFFKKQSRYPKFKKKGKSKESFYNDVVKLKVKNKNVYLSKIGWVKTTEKLPKTKYYNPRVIFDGKYWYLTVTIDTEIKLQELTRTAIGIDLGIEKLATLSTGKIYTNINKTKKVKKLKKKLKRKQKQISRKYEKNKQGRKYVKTKNIIKGEKCVKLIHRKITNIRENHIHQITNEVVKAKPLCIVLEDLNISGMIKNKHLSKSIQEQNLYRFRQILTYKAELNGIKIVIADRFYPSSKTCSKCGSVKKNLKLSDRIYKCNECGFIVDRDLNAAINLSYLPCIPREVKSGESYTNWSSNSKTELDEAESLHSDGKRKYNNLIVINNF